MKTLVCLTEEPSAAEMLKAVLPRITTEIDIKYIPFEGKSDLENHFERFISGWNIPDSYFLLLRDKDAGDCLKIKNHLVAKTRMTGKWDRVCIRIACSELESFYLGDLSAVESGLGICNLSSKQKSRKYRDPDRLSNASQELLRLTNNIYSKIQGSRNISPYLALDGKNKSHSFNVLLMGVRKLLDV